MIYGRPTTAYQKTAVQTANSVQLTIMCYDAVIRDLQHAKALHERRSMDATYEKVRHAQDIITELLVGLNYEGGGQIAQNLSRLYNFMLRQLIGVNSKRDTSIYDHLIRILAELREAWEQVDRGSTVPRYDQMAAAQRYAVA